MDDATRFIFFDDCSHLSGNQLFDKYGREDTDSSWYLTKVAMVRDYCLQASSIDPSPKVRAAALKAAIKLSRDDDAQLRLIALGAGAVGLTRALVQLISRCPGAMRMKPTPRS